MKQTTSKGFLMLSAGLLLCALTLILQRFTSITDMGMGLVAGAGFGLMFLGMGYLRKKPAR